MAATYRQTADIGEVLQRRADPPAPDVLLDWEKVITAVVDHLPTRAVVGAGKIALLAVSKARYWVPRSMAFEQRIAASRMASPLASAHRLTPVVLLPWPTGSGRRPGRSPSRLRGNHYVSFREPQFLRPIVRPRHLHSR